MNKVFTIARRIFSSSSILTAFLILIGAGTGWATNPYVWGSTTAGGPWVTATNWTGGVVPANSSTTSVTFNPSASISINNVAPSSTFTIGTFTAGSTNTGTTALAFSSACTFTITTLNVNTGNLTLGGGGQAVNMTVNTTGTVAANKTFTIGSGCNLTVANGCTFTVAGTLSCSGTVTVASGGTLIFSGSSPSLPSNVTVASGGILKTSGSGGVTGLTSSTINGTFNLAGSTSTATGFNASWGSGSTLIYNGSSQQTANYYEYSGTGQPTNVTVNNSSGVVFNSSIPPSPTITGTLTLTAGVLTTDATGSSYPQITFTTSNTPISVGTGSINPGTTTTLVFGASSAPGGNAFTLPNSLFTTSTDIYTLTIYRTNALTLNTQNLTNYFLNLNKGQLILGTGNFNTNSISTSGTYASGTMVITSSSSGYLQYNFPTGASSAVTIPIGDNTGTKYSPVSFTMSANSTARYLGFRVVGAADPNNGTPSTPADYISRYWNTSISPSTGTYTYSATFQYTSPGDITGTEANMAAESWNGSNNWNVYGTVNTTSHQLSISGLTQATGPLGTDITGRTGSACSTPTLSGTSQASAICSGVTATINLTGLLSNTAQTVTYSFNGSGNQTASFTSSGTTGSFATYRTLTTSDNGQTLTISKIVAGSCTNSSLSNNTVVLSVAAQPTVTLAINNATVCTGTNLATLTATPSGGTGSPTYTWQSTTSLSPPTGMATVGGQTAATLLPSTTSTSGPTSYQVLVTYNGTGCNASAYTTNYPTLTVVAQPTVTLAIDHSTVCTGGTATLTATPSGGTGSPTYTWQSTTSLSPPTGMSTVGGQTAATLLPSTTSTSGPTSYQVLVTYNGTGCNASAYTTNYPTLTVVAQPTVTLAIDHSTVCTGGTATMTATPSGGTGSPTYTWQSTTSLSPPTGMSTVGGQTAATLVPSTASPIGPTAYQVLVTYNGTGCNASAYTTNYPTLTVVAQPTVTLAIDHSTVCTGGTATLTATPSGGTGSPTYTWQSTTSLSPPTGMTTVGGQTAATLLPSTTSTSGPTAYQVLVTYNGTGCNASAYTTNYPTLTVVAQPVSGTLTPTPAPGTVCNGSTVSATATAGSNGTGSIIDYLQYRFDGGSWVAYTSGAPLNTSGHTSVDIETYRTATGGDCNNSTANIVSWTISSSSDTWNGSTSNDWFTAGNWSCGFVPTSTTNVLIPNGLTNPYPQIVGIVGQTAYALALTIQSGASLDILGVNGVNLEVFGDLSNSGTIIENALGKIYAIGSGVQHVTGNNNFTNFIVNNSAGVTIASGSGNSLNVSGTLTLQSGTLTTNGNLTIISNSSGTGEIDDFTSGNTGTISGNLTAQRYVVNPSPSNTTGVAYYYVGAPVGGAAISQWNNDFTNTPINGASDGSAVIPTASCSDVNLAVGSPYGGLFQYVENSVTTCNLAGWHTRFSGSIPAGQGFAGTIPNGTTLALTGSFNTGNISSPALTVTATNITETPGFGWNLISNPYASPIHLLSMFSANSNLSGTAYTYITSGANAGTYLTVNELSYSETGDQLGSSEAFWVEATTNNTTVNFTNSMRMDGANAFLRTVPLWDQMLTLQVAGNGYNDVARIAFGPNFTNGYDQGYDAHKLMGRSVQPNVFVTDSAAKYSIYAIPTVTKNERDIPVSFAAGTSGQFSFSIDLNGFDPAALVFLEDLQTHAVQNLMENSTYSFTSNEGDNAARFVLHFIPAATINITPEDCNGQNGLVVVDMGQYKVAGQPVLWTSYTMTASDQTVISYGNLTNNTLLLTNLPSGMYTLQLAMNGYSIEKQIEVINKKQAVADFTTNTLVASTDDNVVFNNASTGATTYNWQFGDGNSSDLLSPEHTYTTEGTYLVVLTASNSDCSANYEKTVRIENVAAGISSTPAASVAISSYAGEVNIEFNNFTTLDEVTVNIYDLTGRKIMAPQQIATGNNRQVINITDVVSGYYFVVLTGQNYERAGKVFLSTH